MDGYITEKIINAFLSGCIPIYYGTAEIFDIFNEKAFIYYNVSDPEPALKQVAYLESNETAYNETLNQPILANGERTIEKYFSYSDKVGKGMVKHRIRKMMEFPEAFVGENETKPAEQPKRS